MHSKCSGKFFEIELSISLIHKARVDTALLLFSKKKGKSMNKTRRSFKTKTNKKRTKIWRLVMQREDINTLNIHGTSWEPLWKCVYFSLKKVLFARDWRHGKRNIFYDLCIFQDLLKSHVYVPTKSNRGAKPRSLRRILN